MLISQVMVFGVNQDVSGATEWVKSQELQLTQGLQKEIIEIAEKHIKSASETVAINNDAVTTIKGLNALISETVVRVGAKEAVDMVESYADVLLAYMQTGNMTTQDVQWATDEFISLMGKKVNVIVDVNQPRTRYILKSIVEENAMIQGAFSLGVNQRLTVEQLNQKLLDLEKAYRMTGTQLSSVGTYKELGRELSKKLVLKSTSGSVDVTLTTAVLEKLITNKITLVVDDNGIIYEIPVEYMERHIGDFKVTIKSLAQEMTSAYGNKVNDGLVEPVIVKDVKIGYSTNKIPVVIKTNINQTVGIDFTQTPYAWTTVEKGLWTKQISGCDKGILHTSIDGTGIVALSKYQPTYLDITGHWAESKITKLLSCGIVDQSNAQTFAPNKVVTRGEFARMLINIVGTEGKSDNHFVDVPVGSPYADIIESVIYYGFTIGVTGDRFEADTELTREELVALVVKMHEVKYGYKLDEGFVTFKDVNDIAPYAKGAVSAMKEAGYISGFEDNTFRPKDKVSRSVAAVVLYGVLGK